MGAVYDPPMRHDLSSLALFVRIAETRSITKAAAASHIALAAASRRIALLEDQYGVKLLHRTARGVELTPAGHTLLEHARRLMGQANQMLADLSDYAAGTKGVVRLQANTSALTQFLAEDLAAFQAAHPGVKVTVEEERSIDIARALHAGSTDVGIVLEGTPVEGLECRDYRQDRLAAVVPKGHPLRGRQVAFAKLLDHDIVGMEASTALTQLLVARAAAEQKPLRLRAQVKSFEVVARMVQAGLGIGVLPDGAARSFAATMGLRLVPLSDDWALRRMMLCVKSYKSLPSAARNLVDSLKGRTP